MKTRAPELLPEFDYEKNELSPSEIHYRSRYKFWWKCAAEGHSWRTAVNNRSRDGQGCPSCSLKATSTIEKIVRDGLRTMSCFSSVSKDHTDSVAVGPNLFTKRKKVQVDALCVFADGTKLVVEYDGAHWHFGNERRDELKTQTLLDEGYKVIRIREQSRRYQLPMLSLSDPNFQQLTYQYVSKHHVGAQKLVSELAAIIETIETSSLTKAIY